MTTPATRSRPVVDRRVVLLSVVAVSAAYVAWHLDRGWFPVDDGALAHAAERVLRGEVPHRDFDDVYTGGLAYLNALAFRLAGVSFWSMRLVLFVVFVAWVPAVFQIASRLGRPVVAAGVTLLAVVWSLPNYTAPMPSWYNLFLATFGILALLCYLEKSRRRWLLLAGVAGGLSMLVKIVGLYYVAGVLLFLVYQAHAEAEDDQRSTAGRAVVYPSFITAAMVLFVATLAALVRRQWLPSEIVHFVAPGMLIAAMLVHDEWRHARGTSRARFRALAGVVVPFLAGVMCPIVLFLIPYARSGALGALWHGVFVLPARRFGSASFPMLPLSAMLTLLLPALIAGAGIVLQRGRRRVLLAGLLALLLALVVAASARSAPLYRLVWHSARTALPALVLAGVVLLVRSRIATTGSQRCRAHAMLLLCVTAMCSLVQFPFSVAIYFCYVAPLVVLTVVALFRLLPPLSAAVPLLLGTFYGAFAIARINTGAQFGMGRFYLPAAMVPFQALPGARAGIDVPRANASEYAAVIDLLGQHAHGGFTLASPDSPEIYFLSGLRNPTRALYEFFDDSAGHSERVLRALDAHGVTAIVENRKPPFSRPLDPALVASLAARYPNAAEIGPYLVRWR